MILIRSSVFFNKSSALEYVYCVFASFEKRFFDVLYSYDAVSNSFVLSICYLLPLSLVNSSSVFFHIMLGYHFSIFIKKYHGSFPPFTTNSYHTYYFSI